MEAGDWVSELRAVVMLLRPSDACVDPDDPICLALNAGDDLEIQLPRAAGSGWQRVFCSDEKIPDEAGVDLSSVPLPTQSVSLFALKPHA